MKDFEIVDLEDFLKIADSITHPYKFFEVFEDGSLRAEIWMRICLFSWNGEDGEDRIKKLKEHGFIQAKLRETKKFIEDLL